MSSDTAKENVSVVDSSVTDWKHDVGIFDDPESSTYIAAHEDNHCLRADEATYSHGQFGNSTANKKDKLYNKRYFIIKSLNHLNLQLSIEKGIWATQVMNEPILEEAFRNSGRVILIFSVNMSGFFQGYAQMMSSVGWRRDNIWSQGCGKSKPWGRSFRVKWLQLNDLPFQKTLHLKNPFNDYKPVKISRDCQELPENIGEALCNLLDGDVKHRREELPLERSFAEPPYSLCNEEYNVSPLPMTWAQTPMVYPSLVYQQQAEASRLYMEHQSSTGVFCPEDIPNTAGTTKFARMKLSAIDGNLNDIQLDQDMSSGFDVWALAAESPLSSTLTEDDFLEMSYEEYLQARSRSSQKSHPPVAGPSLTMQESSRTKRHEDDLTSTFTTDHRHSWKRALHSSQKRT